MPKFDLDKTQTLGALFAVPSAARDEAWRTSFYDTIVDASMRAFEPQVSAGPDLFPYFRLGIPAPGAFTPFCISHILEYVLDNGFGIAVFDSAGPASEPEWVFSYGDALAYALYGNFDGDAAELRHEHDRAGMSVEKVQEPRQILVGSPSESYYPARAVRALSSFMRERLHVSEPEIKLVVDPTACPAQSLAINLRASDYGGDLERLRAAMHYVRWFLPRTHGLMSLPAR